VVARRLHAGARNDGARVVQQESVGDPNASRVNPTSAEEKPMKRFIALMMVSMFSMSLLSACNTMAGAGKDVQKVGEKVEKKAEDCKNPPC
jgi:predicted small secreted protein